MELVLFDPASFELYNEYRYVSFGHVMEKL